MSSPHKILSKAKIMHLIKIKKIKITCTGWNPQPRRSSCQSWVCGVPGSEHPPRHTASAYTLSIHFPAPSPAASAPPRSPFVWATIAQQGEGTVTLWIKVQSELCGRLNRQRKYTSPQLRPAVRMCAPVNNVRAENEHKHHRLFLYQWRIVSGIEMILSDCLIMSVHYVQTAQFL